MCAPRVGRIERIRSAVLVAPDDGAMIAVVGAFGVAEIVRVPRPRRGRPVNAPRPAATAGQARRTPTEPRRLREAATASTDG